MAPKHTSDWNTAFESMKTNLALSDDAIGVFAISLHFNLDDVQEIASDAITGGRDDKKCDMVYIDKEKEIAVLAQCYISQKHRDAAPSNKASDLNTAITWLLNADMNTLPDSIKGQADELRNAIELGEVSQLHIWYVHNLPGSANVVDELRTVEKSARAALRQYERGSSINVFADEISEERLAELYAQAERAILVNDNITITVPDAIILEQRDWTSVITSVPGVWLQQLYQKYGTSLFSANLRGYLGSRKSDANINSGMKSTALDEPENFCVYNNGITALVHDFKLMRRTRRGRNLNITGISIVNGAQTTGSIGSAERLVSSDLQVAVRFVKVNKDSIVSNIVRYNNSQNKIQAADFRSTDPIQSRLRREFAVIPQAEYEGGRRGGASDAIKRSRASGLTPTLGTLCFGRR